MSAGRPAAANAAQIGVSSVGKVRVAVEHAEDLRQRTAIEGDAKGTAGAVKLLAFVDVGDVEPEDSPVSDRVAHLCAQVTHDVDDVAHAL